MGVLGLTPFIQRHCPEVIRELPHRLRSLSGKIIAIDGTLITQRLHFAPMPCENRHILGWYRLIRDLKDSGVGVICVFDGEERSKAKQRENERRRQLRRTDVARGAMEAERLRRLRRLTELMKQYHGLTGLERDSSTQLLKSATAKPHEPTPDIKLTRSPISHRENFPPSSIFGIENILPKALRNLELTPQEESPSTSNLDDVELVPNESKATTISRNLDLPVDEEVPGDPQSKSRRTAESPAQTTRSPPTLSPTDIHRPWEGASDPEEPPVQLADAPFEPFAPESLVISQNEPKPASVEGHDVASAELETSQSPTPDSVGGVEHELVAQPVTETLGPSPFESDISLDMEVPHDDDQLIDPASAISQDLLALYRDYQDSIPAFLPAMADPPVDVPSEEAADGAVDQHAMSRHQVRLTLDEGILWDSLVNTSLKDDSSIAESELESLARRSDLISKSYEKRNNPPTLKTYEESKLILQAMGIPCIDSVGPYEAEALAASLVHNGMADYVASEDTDVLIYEAPLLRNITSRQSPLTLLSGAEVRQVLQLDRASFVDFALLLGTDFSQRIKNVGPHRAIKLIRAHGRIEHVIANEPKYIPRLPQDAYLEQVAVARLVFETLPPVPDSKLLQPSESDEVAVAAILDRFGVHREAMLDWDFSNALDGNYFDDNPAMT